MGRWEKDVLKNRRASALLRFLFPSTPFISCTQGFYRSLLASSAWYPNGMASSAWYPIGSPNGITSNGEMGKGRFEKQTCVSPTLEKHYTSI